MRSSSQPSPPLGDEDRPASRITSLWSQARLALSLTRLTPFETDTAHGRSQERYRRIALTTLSSLLVRGIGTLVGLITVPIVLQYLGKERYGLWSAITTVVAWVALFDFGIANGLVNALARAHGLGDEEDARRQLWTALVALTGIAVALALALAVVAGIIPWSSLLAAHGSVDDSTVKWSVVAALGVFLAGMPLSVAPQVYAAYQRSYVANLFVVCGILTGFGVVLLVVKAGGGMPALVVAFGIGPLLASTVALVHAVWRGMPWLRPRLSAVSARAFRGLAQRSVPLFLYQLGALAVNETQSIIIAHRCDLSTVAEYAVLMRLYLVAFGLIQMSTASFVPSFREAHERGDDRWMWASFGHFARARVLLAIGAGLVMVVAGNPLLRLWLRRSDIAFPTLTWTALALVLVATARVAASAELLAIMDRLWVLVGLVVVNAASTIALTYVLAPSWRVTGVVIAFGAVTVVIYSWVVPWLARRILPSAEVQLS